MTRKSLYGFTLVSGLLFCILGTPIMGQQNRFAAQVQRSFGPSQKLVNGIQYYDRYTRINSHPYFLNKDFVSGSVIIDGQLFDNIPIRYNLYSQHLELEYETFSEAINTLVMVSEHVDGFTLGDNRFERLGLDGEQRFYQVIETESFACYVYRGMDLLMITQGFLYDEEFKETDLRFMIQVDGEVRDFTNRKSFAACFPEVRQKEIRRFLRQKQFTFKDASPQSLTRRMAEVSGLLKNVTHP